MPQIIIQPLNCVTMSYKTTRNCLKCSILALGLLVLQVATAQDGFADLDQALSAKQKQLGKSYVLQVWKAGDTLAYLKTSPELNARTAVPVAGSSKWLTAALLMVFVDEGKISLDDKITRWLPEFEKYGKNYITLRHCLSHMTGIKSDGSGVGKLFQKKKFDSLEEEVNSYAAREIQSNPGTEFRYNDIGPNIAGRVLEVLTKKRFDQLAKQRLFTPMKMRSTSFSNMGGGPLDPSGGASASADDYMKFLVMLLNKGTYHGRRILSEESVAELLKAQVPAGLMKDVPKLTEGYSYALGSWVANTGAAGTVFTGPAFPGAWPMIDTCRGYAYVYMVKDSPGEEKTRLHMELKSTVDGHFSGNCD
ncbi:MAG: class C beta-lactamase-related serine hydrolase [Chitinophagaceae bacterium]|nr:MAG: class C beta-lactamase-related serine hydrolase [Chitinophagaceae bacterium]